MLLGVRKPYPITINDTEKKKKFVINNCDELIELVDRKFSERRQLTKAVKLEEILWTLVIGLEEEINPIQLVDERTEQVIDFYWFYLYQPHLINNKVWFESVKRLNRIYGSQRNQRII